MQRFISPPGAHKLQRKVHFSRGRSLYISGLKKKKQWWWGTNRRVWTENQTPLQTSLWYLQPVHRRQLELFSKILVVTTMSCFIFLFGSLSESTLSFVGSSVPLRTASLLCYLPLSRDKHLTPGKQMPLISTKTWSLCLLLIFFWVYLWGEWIITFSMYHHLMCNRKSVLCRSPYCRSLYPSPKPNWAKTEKTWCLTFQKPLHTSPL